MGILNFWTKLLISNDSFSNMVTLSSGVLRYPHLSGHRRLRRSRFQTSSSRAVGFLKLSRHGKHPKPPWHLGTCKRKPPADGSFRWLQSEWFLVEPPWSFGAWNCEALQFWESYDLEPPIAEGAKVLAVVFFLPKGLTCASRDLSAVRNDCNPNQITDHSRLWPWIHLLVQPSLWPHFHHCHLPLASQSRCLHRHPTLPAVTELGSIWQDLARAKRKWALMSWALGPPVLTSGFGPVHHFSFWHPSNFKGQLLGCPSLPTAGLDV